MRTHTLRGLCNPEPEMFASDQSSLAYFGRLAGGRGPWQQIHTDTPAHARARGDRSRPTCQSNNRNLFRLQTQHAETHTDTQTPRHTYKHTHAQTHTHLHTRAEDSRRARRNTKAQREREHIDSDRRKTPATSNPFLGKLAHRLTCPFSTSYSRTVRSCPAVTTCASAEWKTTLYTSGAEEPTTPSP